MIQDTDNLEENYDAEKLHNLSMKETGNKNTIYNKWASTYDEYVNKFEYNGPRELVRFIKMYRCHFENDMASDPMKLSVLDFGCGTGLLGQAFYDLFNCDYSTNSMNIMGIDISENMLKKSDEREIYGKLSCLDITRESDAKDVIDKLEAPKGGFDLIMSCGVFLEGHVSISEIERILLKLVKMGGVFAFTVRHSFMKSEEKFFMKLLFSNEITILAKTKINYLKDVEAWAIIIKRL